MAKLTAKDRKGLKSNQFGLPGKAKTPKGKAASGSYPMPDRNHAIAAKAFAKRFASPAQQKTINARANKVLGKTATKKSPSRKGR